MFVPEPPLELHLGMPPTTLQPVLFAPADHHDYAEWRKRRVAVNLCREASTVLSELL